MEKTITEIIAEHMRLTLNKSHLLIKDELCKLISEWYDKLLNHNYKVQNESACKILNKLFWKIAMISGMSKMNYAWYIIGQLRDININISYDEKEEKFEPKDQ